MRWYEWFAGIVMGIIILAGLSLALQFELPAPTGPHAVGRTSLLFEDFSRPEPMTPVSGDHRQVRVEIWYPAAAGSGEVEGYFPELALVSDGLRASGEVSWIETVGLSFIRSDERLDGTPEAGPFPLVLFSPGNGTNAEFNAGLAGDLASHGYVVVALNHPYDVAAVALADDAVAVLAEQPLADRQAFIAGRVAVRAADLLFVLDRLAGLARAGDGLAAQIDFTRVAALGHSLGGIAAAQACAADPRFIACGNLDGIQAGGIFAVIDRSLGPPQPFLFLTKEAVLAPALLALLEERTAPTVVATIAGAAHDSFTDGPALQPGLLPFANEADRIMGLVRETVRAFLDRAMAGQPPAFPPQDGVAVRTFGGISPA